MWLRAQHKRCKARSVNKKDERNAMGDFLSDEEVRQLEVLGVKWDVFREQ